jgi:hypothetical protein
MKALLNKFKLSLFILIIFYSFSAPAKSQAIKPINLVKGWEKWQEKVPVGAEFFVGISNDINDIQLNPSKIYVSIPKVHDDKLCVSLNSIDGKYKAKLEYNISKLPKGEYEFEIPTEYNEKISTYKTQHVAIIAKSSSKCDLEEGKYHISKWQQNSKKDSFNLYFGGETPVSLTLIDSNNKMTKIRGKKIDGNKSISYKWRCEVPQEFLSKSSKIIVNRIFRSGGDTMERPESEIEIQ